MNHYSLFGLFISLNIEEEEEEQNHPAEPSKPTDAGYLLVLTERELIAIDLTQPSWPIIPSPYLKHVDCTGITALDHITVSDPHCTNLKL